MRTLIVSDIHGNLPALTAVLATPEARACGEILSLGDHTCFCAQSREVHDLLRSLGAAMLTGNHEQRLLRASDPEFDGYNWAPLRWTAARMQGADLRLPTDLRRDRLLFTHGTPGDPFHLVHPPELPQLLQTLPTGVDWLISGHNHIRWDVTDGGKRAFNPGSVGLAEDGLGGMAPFAVLETEPDAPPRLTAHAVPYNVADALRALIATGMHRAAPEITRAVAHVLQTGEYQGVMKLMHHVSATARQHGLSPSSPAAWRLADRTYPWPEPVPSTDYWSHMAATL